MSDMAKLDWIPDCTDRIQAASRVFHNDGGEMLYTLDYRRGFELWTVRFEGTEIVRGTLQACLDACEASEAEGAGATRAAEFAAAGGHWPETVDEVEPASAAELIEKSGQPNMLAERRFTDEQMEDLVERIKRT